MSFKFLGKKPPQKYKHYAKGATEEEYLPNDKELSEHFRGALKEASDFIDSYESDLLKMKVSKTKGVYFIPKFKLARMLRVSAGDDEE